MKKDEEHSINIEPGRINPDHKFLLTIEKDYRIKYACESFNRIFGAIGKHLHELPPPFSGSRWRKKIDFLFHSGHDLLFTDTFSINGKNRKYRIDFRFAGDIVLCNIAPDAETGIFVQKLNKSKNTTRKVSNVLPDYFPDIYCVVTNVNGKFIIREISPTVEKVVGYSAEKLTGENFDMYFKFSDQAQFLEKVNGKALKDIPAEFLASDGKLVPVGITVKKDSSGTYFIVICDRNKFNSLENLLQEKENFYKSLLENSIEITSVINKEGYFEYISPAVKKLMGYEPSELTGKFVFDLIHPDDHEFAYEAFSSRIREGGIGKRIDWRFKNKSDQYRFLSVMINAGLEGILQDRVVINALDVTERYNAEKKLIRSNYRFQLINEINKIILGSSSVKNIAESAMKLILDKLISCERASLCLINNDSAEFIASEVRYGKSAIEKGVIVPLEQLDSIDHLRRGEYYLTEDVTKKENLSLSDHLLVSENIHSYLVFPLTANSKLIGALFFGSSKKGFFKEEIIDFINGIASAIAVGIEEAFLKEQLVISESHKSAIVNGIPDLIFRLDKKGYFLDGVYNESALMHILPEKVQDKKITQVLEGKLGKDYLSCAGNALITGEMQLLEHEYISEKGTFYFEARFSPTVHNEVIILVRDITSAVNSLTELELRKRAIDTSPEGTFIANASNGQILFFNQALSKIGGFSDSVLQKMIFSGDDSDKNNILKSIASDHKPSQILSRLEKSGIVKIQDCNKKKNGIIYWSTLTIHALRRNGKITHYVGSVSDVTRMKNLEHKIMNKVMDAQEHERKRIAGELHDGLAQTMTAVNMYFHALMEMHGNNPSENVTSKITAELINKAILEARLISYNLMPSSLIKFGLVQSILELKDRYAFSTNTKIEFIHSVSGKRFDNGTEITLFRIVQELMSNAIKHADASNLKIELLEKKGYLFIIVTDNGKGFNLRKDQQGTGLQNLKARVKAIYGTFHMRTTKGKGTTIKIKLPGINKLN